VWLRLALSKSSGRREPNLVETAARPAPILSAGASTSKVKAQTYSFEAANGGTSVNGTHRRNAKLPAGEILMPGVVIDTTNLVEHPQLSADGILRDAATVAEFCFRLSRVYSVAGDAAYSLPSRSWIRPARRWRCTAMPTWFGRSLGHAR